MRRKTEIDIREMNQLSMEVVLESLQKILQKKYQKEIILEKYKKISKLDRQ